MYDPKTFELLKARIKECSRTSVKKAVETLGGNVQEFLQRKTDQHRSHEKRLFSQCHNLVASYVDGLKSGEVEPSGLRLLIEEISGAEKAYEERVFKVKEKAKLKAQEEGDLETAETVDKWDPGAGAKDTFGKYERWKGKLPSSTKKSFTATRMPIVVVSKGIPDMAKMRKTGLVEDFLFGYPIIKEQVLVGMNLDWLRSRFGKKNDQIDYEAVEDFLVSELKQRVNKKFIRMGNIHKFEGLMWMWLANERELSRLNGTTSGGNFTVADWTLPFEQEVKQLRGH